MMRDEEEAHALAAEIRGDRARVAARLDALLLLDSHGALIEGIVELRDELRGAS